MKTKIKTNNKKLIIDKETFDGLKKLLDSKNESDNIVTLNIINNTDLKKNTIAVLLLYRMYKNDKMWLIHAKSKYNNIRKLAGMPNDIGFNAIYDLICKSNIPDPFNLFMYELSNFCSASITNVLPFIKKIEITL